MDNFGIVYLLYAKEVLVEAIKNRPILVVMFASYCQQSGQMIIIHILLYYYKLNLLVNMLS